MATCKTSVQYKDPPLFTTEVTNFFCLRQNWHSRHDAFNILALPVVCTLNVLYLLTESENFLRLQFFSFLLYLSTDTLWVLIKPESVASPLTIIIHHIVCLYAWVDPYIYAPEFSKWISAMLLVEINTFLLIAKRDWPERIMSRH